MPLRETIEQAGYTYGGFSPEFGFHMLIDKKTGRREFWFANKNHASYGIIYKNTHLEFATGDARYIGVTGSEKI